MYVSPSLSICVSTAAAALHARSDRQAWRNKTQEDCDICDVVLASRASGHHSDRKTLKNHLPGHPLTLYMVIMLYFNR